MFISVWHPFLSPPGAASWLWVTSLPPTLTFDPTKGLGCWACVPPLACVPRHLPTFKTSNGQGDCAAIHSKFSLVYGVILQTFFLKGQEIFAGCLFLCMPRARAGVCSKYVQRTLLSWGSQFSGFRWDGDGGSLSSKCMEHSQRYSPKLNLVPSVVTVHFTLKELIKQF